MIGGMVEAVLALFLVAAVSATDRTGDLCLGAAAFMALAALCWTIGNGLYGDGIIGWASAAALGVAGALRHEQRRMR